MARTCPFMIGFGAGLGWLIGAMGRDEFQGGATVLGGVPGFGVTAGILYLLREYIHQTS